MTYEQVVADVVHEQIDKVASVDVPTPPNDLDGEWTDWFDDFMALAWERIRELRAVALASAPDGVEEFEETVHLSADYYYGLRRSEPDGNAMTVGMVEDSWFVCVHLDGDVDSTLRATMVASELRDEAGLRAMLAAVGMMFAGFANGADVDTFPNEQLEGA